MVPGKEAFHQRNRARDSRVWQLIRSFRRTHGRFSPAGILAITVAGIATAEVVAMVFVYYAESWPYVFRVLLDALVMAIIITPQLYFLSTRPLLKQIQQRQQSERIMQTRLRLMDYATGHSINDLLQFALDELEVLTQSKISFIHFIEANQTVINLQAWSTNTLKNLCKADRTNSHYDLDRAGVWADAVRERRGIIHNSIDGLPNRKGLPEGHAPVVREMVVPVIRDKKVVAVLGVGNKPKDYTKNDLNLLSTLADFFWDIVNDKQANFALRQSEEKFRTFVDWTYDWELWVSPDGKIVYSSPSCERITGHTAEAFLAEPELLLEILHPDDRSEFEEHRKLIHNPRSGHDMITYRIIARDGSVRWIEHICRPLFDASERYLGRRISNREITERKESEKRIFEQSQKEMVLTQALQTIQTDIARDLHDMLGQNISFLSMNLEHLSENQSSEPTRTGIQIQHMTRVASESYELIRAMLAILTFGESTDPLKLFNHYANQVADRSELQIDFTSRGQPTQLSPHQIRQLFYIFREALRNVEKYAKASQVRCAFLWAENSLTMTICDNGVGFDPGSLQTNGHYGLKFMRERAKFTNASFDLQSAPGEGVTITVIVRIDSPSLA